MTLMSFTLNLGRYLIRRGWSAEVHGAENVPSEGPVILAANHVGWLDGPLLLLATDRPIAVLAKHELWETGFKHLLKPARAIPIDWRRADRTALHVARQHLLSNGALGIFPEGTRCAGRYEWLRDGISYLVAHTQASVVPVAVFGTRSTGESRDAIPKFRTRVSLHVGAPILANQVLPTNMDKQSRSHLKAIGIVLQERLRSHVLASEQISAAKLPTDDVSRPEDHLR